jgi:hypothetical protein
VLAAAPAHGDATGCAGFTGSVSGTSDHSFQQYFYSFAGPWDAGDTLTVSGTSSPSAFLRLDHPSGTIVAGPQPFPPALSYTFLSASTDAVSVGLATPNNGTAWSLTFSCSVTPPAPSVIGTGLLQNSQNKSVGADLSAGAADGDVVVASVATGTFQGAAGCTDDSPSPNTWYKVADKNTGAGRLFVCVSKLTNALTDTNTVSGTYPQFSGASAIQVDKFDGGTTGGFPAPSFNTNSGSNPTVSSGQICATSRNWIFGVVANSNISSFAVDNPPWTPLGSNSVGSGAGKRTLTTSSKFISSGSCPTDVQELSGKLQSPGSGSWQAAIVALPHS